MVKPSGRRSFLTDLPATPLNLRRRGAFQSPTELLSMKIRPSAAAVGALTVAASMLGGLVFVAGEGCTDVTNDALPDDAGIFEGGEAGMDDRGKGSASRSHTAGGERRDVQLMVGAEHEGGIDQPAWSPVVPGAWSSR